MYTINVAINNNQELSYPIFIGKQILKKLPSLIKLDKYSKVIVVADEAVKDSALNPLQEGIGKNCKSILLDITEEKKSLDSVENICRQLMKIGADRKSLVLNLGGGVIGDLGGFAASIYMRGIPFIQIPTTLLAQVDASVGGKVGVNFQGVKNILGTFQQPEAVIIDTATLVTLPDRDTLSGFAEILKHAFILDASYLEILSDSDSLPLEAVIKRSCEIKASVISQDEREGGYRKILNFGHTFGHAFEVLSHATKTPLSHGEAVAVGMCAEAKLSVLTGLLAEEDLLKIEQYLERFHLPIELNFSPDFPSVLELIKSDKKNHAGQIYWTLLNKIGSCAINQTASLDLVKQAFLHVSPLSNMEKFDA